MFIDQRWNDAITVTSVGEEYSYIKKQKCTCGGTYLSKLQSLFYDDDKKPFDFLTCECLSCGQEKGFYFDISKFFKKG